MQITKNGFYDLSAVAETEIVVADGIIASFFDDGKVERNIFLQTNSKLDFYFLGEEKVEFFQEEKSKLSVNGLLFAEKNGILNGKIRTKILKSDCDVNIKIISVAKENSHIKLDGIISIIQNTKNVNAQLKEENIFLGETGKIEASPKLEVASNDVKASHSCKVERLDKNKMFYLKSRGISENEVVKLLLEANVKALFGKLGDENGDFYGRLLKKIGYGYFKDSETSSEGHSKFKI